jgi:ABC-type transporter Mla subunit MlaD
MQLCKVEKGENFMRRFHTMLLIFLWATTVFAADQADSFQVHVRFEQVFGLHQGDGVIFQDKSVGFVKTVTYGSDGYFTATLGIDKCLAKRISAESLFIIIEDPLTADRKAVMIFQAAAGGPALKDGATVQGSDKYEVMLEAVKKNLESGIDFLQKGMSAFSKELKNLPENEKVKALNEELKRLSNAMQRATKETQEKIRQEILPSLKKELEALRRELQHFDKEDEMAPLENEMKKIERI